jgi:hypothetical protein
MHVRLWHKGSPLPRQMRLRLRPSGCYKELVPCKKFLFRDTPLERLKGPAWQAKDICNGEMHITTPFPLILSSFCSLSFLWFFLVSKVGIGQNGMKKKMKPLDIAFLCLNKSTDHGLFLNPCLIRIQISKVEHYHQRSIVTHSTS